MTAPLLEVRDVAHAYGSTRALAGVSFQVNAGEIFGLLGPNGAGKTTLLSLLAGLREPTSGNVLLEGQPLHPGNHRLKRLIGLVPQEIALYPELTAAENLRFFGALYRLNEAELGQRVEKILAMIGLTERAHHRAATFSGGMQRRLNLGVALVHGPRLLLLDEPTAGVDPQSRNHLFEGVRKLNAEGITILYTSHYMEEVQALCHRIGIMDHGRLIACDSLPKLLARLPGKIRFRLSETPPSWGDLIDSHAVSAISPNGTGAWVLECRDISVSAVRLVAWCKERNLQITELETEGPNLERVFLSLTGHGLRD